MVVDTHAAKPWQPPPPVVTVASVEQREITDSEELTGRAEVEAVEVFPRGSGHIQEVSVQPIVIEQRKN